MSRKRPGEKYPRNWPRVSRTIRRLAGGSCEWCKRPTAYLGVHHIGAPLATGEGWRAGNPQDKHDVRRENLVALCIHCHETVEPVRKIARKAKAARARRRAKREAHHALGVGTGLVPLGAISHQTEPGEHADVTSHLSPSVMAQRGWLVLLAAPV